MQIHNTTVIEVARNIKTKSGAADLFKCWDEQTQTIAAVWSDCSKPSPFLKGLEVGDTVRLVAEEREEMDLHGKTTSKTYFTPIPAKPVA